MLTFLMSAFQTVTFARQYFRLRGGLLDAAAGLEPRVGRHRPLKVLSVPAKANAAPAAGPQSFRVGNEEAEKLAEPRGFGVQPGDAAKPGIYTLLPAIPPLKGKNVRAYYNPVSLAFLGDAVWEVYIRTRHFYPPLRLKQYYEDVVGDVRAEAQETFLEIIRSGGLLTEEEEDIVKWGKNAKVGYLFVTDQARLHQVMHYLGLAPKDERQR